MQIESPISSTRGNLASAALFFRAFFGAAFLVEADFGCGAAQAASTATAVRAMIGIMNRSTAAPFLTCTVSAKNQV